MLIDTHCHLHMNGYKLDPLTEIAEAKAVGVGKIILVGENAADSQLAIDMAQTDEDLFATAGLHPHEAKNKADLEQLSDLLSQPKVVGVGECGLDYWYEHSSREDQIAALKFQIDLAISHKLPMSLHIRGSKQDPNDAFEDFFSLCDLYHSTGQTIRGVVHSFSSGQAQLEGVLSRSLYVGLNGIATFADAATQEVINTVPLDSILLETDTPFLTPTPKRGTINAPKYLVLTAEHLAKQRGISLDKLVAAASSNTNQLFGI